MSNLRTTALALLLATSNTTLAIGPATAQSVVLLTATVAPPPLPVYLQPPIPGPGYLWSPGYWDWDPVTGYYWVPGTWVLPPRPSLLWTPAYWAWSNGVYAFHPGYWGPQVGFYGGISYGFGYGGTGFQGGYWNGGTFFYNRSVTNVTNINITNVYNQPVAAMAATRASYNGGAGGTSARPTPQQMAMAQQPHEPPTPSQLQQAGQARGNPALHFSANHGAPPIAATPHANVFNGTGIVSASPRERAAPPASAIRMPASASPANALPAMHAPAAALRPAGAAPGASRPAPAMPARSAATPPHPEAQPNAAALARQNAAVAQQRIDQMTRQQSARQQQMRQRMQVQAQRQAQMRMAAPRMPRPAAPHPASRGHR